jgi:hypothetical protein
MQIQDFQWPRIFRTEGLGHLTREGMMFADVFDEGKRPVE